MTATVVHPTDHAMTITVGGREIATNRIQLIFARRAMRLHITGIRFKVSPVAFMYKLTGERRTARAWLTFLDSVL